MDLYGRVVAARPGEPYYLTAGDDDVAGTGEHVSSLELRMRQILEEAGLLDADAPLPSGVTQTAHSARDILTAPLLYFDEVSVGLSLSPPNRARPR